MTDEVTPTGPFGRAARLYRAAGWSGTLPLGGRPGRKSPPPNGFTGHGAPYPSNADVGVWEAGPEAYRNIGLRLPPGVIGLDVDAGYTKIENGKGVEKHGEVTLAELESRLGPLPPTWVSSARPAPSGIRFYQVPETLDGQPINWPGEAGKFIEIIQTGHRYAVVWPSTNPDAEEAMYRWRHADLGDIGFGQVPAVHSLAPLPETWIRGLALPYNRADKADLGNQQLRVWWDGMRPGDPCPVIATVLSRAAAELREADGARHETARDAARAIVAAGGSGHRGAEQAVSQLAAAFEAAVGPERIRSGEWSRLLRGAVQLAAAEHPRPRQSCEHDGATVLAVPEDVAAGFTQPGASAPGEVTPPTAPGGLTLPDEFWAARGSLSRIRQAAHSRVRSGDVVFYGMLCRLAAMAPHTLRADTGIGSPASLNLFAAVVGPSGGGKSSGLSVSRTLVKTPRDLDEFALGSGEGIAEAFMGEAEEPTGEMARDGSEKTRRVRKMVRHNALFHTDEGNSLNKLIERSGSTVGETLRSAWSGETIGQKNGRAETTRTVPAGSYALGAVIGYQPSTVLPLLGDHEAGTPQRFLFCWAVDASIPGRAERVPWPGEMLSPFPSHVQTDLPAPGALVTAAPQPDLVPLTFAAAILDELYEIEHAKNTGSLPAGHPLLDPFRSQHPVLKVKVSALLALLESRRNVTEEDWRLAQMVLDTSDRVREYLQALALAAAGKARAAALAAEAEAEHHRAHARASVAAALDSSAERRLAARIAVWVHEGGPLTLGAIRKRCASRDRPAAEAAVDLAVEVGWVAIGPDLHVHPGSSRPAA